MRWRSVACVLVLLSVACTSACTGSATPRTHPTSAPATHRRHGPKVVPSRVPASPVTSVRATRCRFVATDLVHRTMGVRLGRLTVQRAGSRVVGCRFYALQGGPLHRSEHLPGPNQPALEVTTARYTTSVGAHNAFILLSEKGGDPTAVALGHGAVGVCFQDHFDPADHGRDWTCATSVGSTAIVVYSVDTTGTFNTTKVLRAVVSALV